MKIDNHGDSVQHRTVPDPDRPLRLFVALWPGRATAAALHARGAGVLDAGARPVAAARLHLTLHFLGDVDAARVPALTAALTAVPAAGPLALRFAAPTRWAGGLVVLPLREVPQALRSLHAALGEAIGALGLRVESGRRFKPHVTLARRQRGPLASVPAMPVLTWRVQGGPVLVSSLRGPGGGYRILARLR